MSPAALAEQGARLAAEGKTPLYFADEQGPLGLIAVADVLKATSPAAVRELRQMGIDVVMLTGDNSTTAQAIGRQAGIEQSDRRACCPSDKERHVRAACRSRAKKWPWWATASTMRRRWPGPMWALPSAPAPTWPLNRRMWC